MSNHGPFFPLDADSTDCLLTTLHDFQSLQGFILSSKFVYFVFRSRQQTILGAVSHNQLGLALPQAMLVVRYLGGIDTSTLIHKFHREAGGSGDFTITPAQARLLRDHATTVRTLEDIYSWREKDPRSRISRLSIAESLRFQQSVYRFWLLSVAYGPSALACESSEYSSSNALEFKDSVVAKQKAFLLSLGENELIGVDEVHSFLLDLAKWALVKQSSRQVTGHRSGADDNYLVWSGPAVTLDALMLMGNQPYFDHVDSQWHGTWRAMTHAFHATEIVSITGGEVTSAGRQRFILENPFLQTIGCSSCQQHSPSRRVSLWSRCNWEYMILVLPPFRLWNFLSSEKKKLLESLVLFAEAVASMPYHMFIEEVFDIRSEQYKDRDKDDWSCTQCMTKFLSDNLQTWFDETVMKAAGHRVLSTN